jgi:(p)ppGpp synthase/HD superfamily hydrolase
VKHIIKFNESQDGGSRHKMRKAYQIISNYYGNSTTKRSGIKLINHIDEGIEILESIGAEDDTIDAYCLHPILQSDEDFNKNYTTNFDGVPTSAIILAVEYRSVANSYLSDKDMEGFVGFTNNKIKQMLFADKKQNEKDFTLYHEGTHERSKELRNYFNNWLNNLLK